MADINLKCPYCSGTEFILGKQSGYANVYVKKKLVFQEAALYHEICKSCGSVVRSYIEDPEELAAQNNK